MLKIYKQNNLGINYLMRIHQYIYGILVKHHDLFIQFLTKFNICEARSRN